jgi:hypothetical protein
MILLKDSLHMIRVIVHIGRPEQEAKMDDITISMLEIQSKANRVAPERGCRTEW